MTMKGKTDSEGDAALQRELESLLSVNPSHDFHARVRARVAREDAPAQWRSHWIFAVASAFAAATALAVVWISRSHEVTPSVQTAQVEVARVAEPTPSTRVVPPPVTPAPPAPRRIPKAAAREPQLLIAANEANALRRALTGPLIQLPGDFRAPGPVIEIQTPAIVIEPLNRPAPIVIEPIELPKAAEEAGRP